MKIQIDAKSAALGLLLGVVATVTLGAVAHPAVGPVGRFRVEAGTHNVFVIDTVTGQLWRGHSNSGVDADFNKAKLGKD